MLIPERDNLTMIGMLSKFWIPGEVKTRLAQHVGPEVAASIHQHFTLYLTRELSTIADFRYVFTAPDDRCPQMQVAVGSAWSTVPQGHGDLGIRMARALRSMLRHRCQRNDSNQHRAILIGADLPTLKTSHLDAAFAALQDADLVLGPAIDGGYYLIGLAGPWQDSYHRLFQSMPWSTAQVFAKTMQVVHESKLSYRLLDPCGDIDDLTSLQRLLDANSTDEALMRSVQELLTNRPVTCE